MKIERLIGILSVLLQKDMVTAADLADMFEVSRRTIQRDIEDLCRAGIPLNDQTGNRRRYFYYGKLPNGSDCFYSKRDEGYSDWYSRS